MYHKRNTKLSNYQEPRQAIRWLNGRVTVLDQNNERIQILEGRYDRVVKDVFGAAHPDCLFFRAKSWHCMQQVLRGAW